ncbi:MAG: YceD family protein [Acidimicrobiia bacterium]
MTGLRMNISDLLRRPGSTRQVHLEVPFEGLENLSARVEETEPLVLDLRLESLIGGVVASGRVRGRWSALCSRCLAPLCTEFDLHLREVFEEDPVEEETYPLRHEEIDLEQPLRDLVVPELPIVPLCRPDCAGLCATCGANLNEGTCGCEPVPVDPRWEALRDLEL